VIGIDTNVLVRYFVQDDPGQTALASELLTMRCTAESPGWINRVVLCEFVWVLERAYKCPRAEIAGVIEVLAQTAELQIEDLGSVWTAVRVYRRDNVDFADALLSSVNLGHGCGTTVTFDRRAGRLEGMHLLSA